MRPLIVSRCKVTKSKFVTVSLCQSMSLYITLCHFPIHSLFLDAKLQKVNLALSPFVTFQQIAFSRCKVTEKKFGTVRICPHMSAYVRKCPLLSAFLLRCKVTQKIIGTVQLCPAMSICVHLCPATA